MPPKRRKPRPRARRPRTKWADLPKEVRQRYADTGRPEFELSRRQVRERYNRGTYNPGSRVTRLTVPTEYRHTDFDVLYARAVQKATFWLAGLNEDKYREGSLRERLSYASIPAWQRIIDATGDDIVSWVSEQTPTPGHEWLFVQIEGQWVNILWYH
jgi:hypothetical protein